MKHLISILAALAIIVAPAAAQTIKTLGYNTTNGQVVANTGTNVLTFTNASVFPQIVSSDMTADNLTVEGAIYFTETLTNAATTRANLGFSTNLNTLWTATNTSNARSAVGLGLAALTNTSNVTTMRALAGSTNTNEPHSGVIELSDGTSGFELTFSNGILLKIIGPL